MSEIAHKLGAFEIRQRVHVRDTEITATVQAILLNEIGTQYQISYWHENIRRVEWVLTEELEP